MTDKSIEEIATMMEKNNFEWSWYANHPNVGFWKEDFSDLKYREALDSLVTMGEDHVISLYFHFPFCPKQCWYCVCHTHITTNQEKINDMLMCQFKEIDMLNSFFESHSFKPNFKGLHLGGGSPSYMDKKQMQSVVKKINTLVTLDELKEFSIEVDPRVTSVDDLIYYSDLGVDRISFGIQDIDPNVQKSVNRNQPIEMAEKLLSVRHLFKSINFDLLYGLPSQTRTSFRKTIDEVIKFDPDKISLGYMCYRPDLVKHHRAMKDSEIPSFYESSLMFVETVDRLKKEGYLRIGIDHFAKERDPLGIALRNKTLGRAAMGHTNISEDLIGVGPWAMSRIGKYYSQNKAPYAGYSEGISKGEFSVFRGYILNKDDMIRRDVIRDIICFARLDYNEINSKYDIDFRSYFNEELKLLDSYVRDGMVKITSEGFILTPIGEFFKRHVCTCFDQLYRGKESYKFMRTAV